jgi:tetratricopeptide (TPR) repeat protein
MSFGFFLLISWNNSFAQIEDEFMLEEETEEEACVPESLQTIYDLHFENEEETSEMDLRRWYSFGSEYFKNKNYEAALPYLWKVFLAGQYRADYAVRKIAESYFNLKYADSTLIACYRGLEKYPDQTTLHYFAGFLQDNLGRYRCAIPHYEALVEANPEEKNYLDKLAFLYFKDENDEAIEIQQRLVDLDPSNSEYNSRLADYINHFLGPGGALEAHMNAWKSNPDNIELALRAGKAAYDAGKYRDAIDPLSRVISKDKKNVEAYEYRAMSYEGAGDFKIATEDFKKIVGLEPENARIMCAIASAYKNLNQFANAKYWVKRALQTRQNYGLAYITMAEIYEAAVVYCQNKENRSRKYDDGLVYQLAYNEYTKAERDPEFAITARSRKNSLKTVLPTSEEKFMNQNRTKIKASMTCYSSWIK